MNSAEQRVSVRACRIKLDRSLALAARVVDSVPVEIYLRQDESCLRRADGASHACQRPDRVAPRRERRIHCVEGRTEPVPFVAVGAPQVGDEAEHCLGKTPFRLFNRVVGQKKSLEIGRWLAGGGSC